MENKIEKITVNGTLMITGATTTGQEGNRNMNQVTQAPEMMMAELEKITTTMTGRATATVHQVSPVCTTTITMQMELLLHARMRLMQLTVMKDHSLAATTGMKKSSMAS